MIAPEVSESVIYHKALALLARREHSRWQLYHKLHQRYPEWPLDEILDRLEAEQALSDTRFAELYALHRSEKGYGPKRLLAELAERGVASELAQQTLQNLSIDWSAIIQRLVQRLNLTSAHRRKHQRWLYQRGFTIDQIKQVIP